MIEAALVGVGGAVGATARYLVGVLVRPVDAPLPVDTLAVNVLGSFALGLVTFSGAGSELVLFVGTGACGSFTTFSSFSVETVRLWERGDRRLAVANATANLVTSLAAIGLAWGLVSVGSL